MDSHGAGPNFACSARMFIEAPLGVKQKLQFEIFHGDTLTNEWDTLRELNPAKKPSFDAIVANPPLMNARAFTLRAQPVAVGRSSGNCAVLRFCRTVPASSSGRHFHGKDGCGHAAGWKGRAAAHDGGISAFRRAG